MTSAKEERKRRNAMIRLHNYLNANPRETTVRLAIRNTTSSDHSERIRKLGVGILSLSSNDSDFGHALQQMALDPSPEVQLWAIEQVAKVSEEKYWTWLTPGGGRAEAKNQHLARRPLAKHALEALAERSPFPKVKEAARKAAGQF